MGNIRQTNIKNISERLINEYKKYFTKDFEKNKHLVTKYSTIKSKVIRNRVAGYITRRMSLKSTIAE